MPQPKERSSNFQAGGCSQHIHMTMRWIGDHGKSRVEADRQTQIPHENPPKSRKTAFRAKIFFACGAPKKEGGLAALAERDPPSASTPVTSKEAADTPGS